MKLLIQDSMSGVKIGDMKGIGNTTKCMVLAKYNGRMAESIKDSIKMIRNMDKEHFTGLMVASMLEAG